MTTGPHSQKKYRHRDKRKTTQIEDTVIQYMSGEYSTHIGGWGGMQPSLFLWECLGAHASRQGVGGPMKVNSVSSCGNQSPSASFSLPWRNAQSLGVPSLFLLPKEVQGPGANLPPSVCCTCLWSICCCFLGWAPDFADYMRSTATFLKSLGQFTPAVVTLSPLQNRSWRTGSSQRSGCLISVMAFLICQLHYATYVLYMSGGMTNIMKELLSWVRLWIHKKRHLAQTLSHCVSYSC